MIMSGRVIFRRVCTRLQCALATVATQQEVAVEPGADQAAHALQMHSKALAVWRHAPLCKHCCHHERHSSTDKHQQQRRHKADPAVMAPCESCLHVTARNEAETQEASCLGGPMACNCAHAQKSQAALPSAGQYQPHGTR